MATRAAIPWENIVDLHQQTVDQDVLADPQCEFAVGIYRLEPHQLHPLHLHTAAAEFYFVVAGRARFTVGDELVDGTAGTTIYLPVGLPHAIQTANEPVEVHYSFTPADINALGTTFI